MAESVDVSNEMENLKISSIKDELLKNIYQYFTEKGYRFATGKTVEPVSKFEIVGKPFIPTLTALILKKDEEPPSDYTDIKYCESLDEILAAGVKMRNELIIFTLDCLAEEP